MVVLQINAVVGIRSTGRMCSEIDSYLRLNGIESHIAYSLGFHQHKGYKIGNWLDRKLHALFSRITGLQGYFSVIATIGLLKYINKVKPDVIHLHNLHSNYINLPLLFKYIGANNIKLVLTLHDCWFYTGKCSHYTVAKCERWLKKCGKCPQLMKDNPSLFFDFTQKTLKDKKKWMTRIKDLQVIGVSNWITEEAQKSILSSAKRILRIYNWIDLDLFYPRQSNLREVLDLGDKFIILGVASDWSDAKGLSKFNELAEVVSSEMQVILIGNLPNAFTLSNNIIHVNETHDVTELADYYSISDVLLNLSLEESFGKVSAEALACGTPIIAIDSTANRELLGEGCGKLLTNPSTENILDAINDLSQHKGNPVASKKTHLRDYAKKNFSSDKNLNEYLTTYSNLTIKQ